jgi:three-Cys-motif partner protein
VEGSLVGRDFFDETTEQSAVKTDIVSKYFFAWVKIMLGPKVQAPRVAYVDLFCGPGKYNDGTPSTPLMVLEHALGDNVLRGRLVTLFNDHDQVATAALRDTVSGLVGIESLAHSPRITEYAIGADIMKVVEDVRRGNTPTLFFVDPWGYKGLSLSLINAAVRDWGCDCIFFFNYNRINAGLNNDKVREHMDALFGKERADELRHELQELDPKERELTIVEKITEALSANGLRYVLPFTFKKSGGVQTSHQLIFVTKSPVGYKIMKGIMAKESTDENQGVPSFQYNPATVRQPLLFNFVRPLDELEGLLCSEYAGQELTFDEIFRRHSIGRPYVEKNYREVLRKLEAQGRIVAVSPAERRPVRKGEVTFAGEVKVKFPAKDN